MNGSIHPIDLAIIAGYFTIVLAIGVVVALRTKTGEDLFLGGRTLTWGVIGLSLFASNISSTTLIGLTGSAYTTGIAVSNYEWMSGLPLIIAAAVFIPIFLHARITTVPEYLELRFDRRSRRIFSVITIVVSIIVDTAGGLYAGAVVLKVFFPDLIIWQTTLVLALVAGAYTAFGGLKAVVYTDSLQAAILLIGCALLTWMLFAELNFSWQTVSASVPEGHLSVIRPLDDPTLPWLGTLVGVPLLGFWYWVTNQYITQRVLGARNVAHARWGAILGGLLKIVPLFVMVLPGAMAISVMPGIANGDMVFPTLVSEFLPVGIVGIVLAGLVSAILSSVDSTLNSAATLIVVDFVKPGRPDLTPRATAWWGRSATLVLMLVAAVWAPNIANFGGLWAYLQQVFSIIVPPIAAVFLLGVFMPRGSPQAAFTTLWLGIVLGIGVFLLAQAGVWRLHFSINVGLMFVVSALIFVIVSLRTARKPGVETLVYRAGLVAPDPGTPWYTDYRTHAALLLLAMISVLVGFW